MQRSIVALAQKESLFFHHQSPETVDMFIQLLNERKHSN